MKYTKTASACSGPILAHARAFAHALPRPGTAESSREGEMSRFPLQKARAAICSVAALLALAACDARDQGAVGGGMASVAPKVLFQPNRVGRGGRTACMSRPATTSCAPVSRAIPGSLRFICMTLPAAV